MLRRVSLAFFSAAIVLLLVTWGCKDVSRPADNRIKIAYVAKLKDDGFHDAIFKGIREESIKQGVDVDAFYGHEQQDLDGQRKLLAEILQSKKYKGVMLAPNDSEALVGDVGRLDAADVPFVFVFETWVLAPV